MPSQSTENGRRFDRLMRQMVLMRSTHILMAVVAAAVYESQRSFSHYSFWRSSGWGVIAILLVAIWPYVLSCIIVWRQASLGWTRPWIFCAVLVLSTALACIYYMSSLNQEYGVFGTSLVTMLEFGVFSFFAKWTFEDLVNDF
jgi:hypothetical protein